MPDCNNFAKCTSKADVLFRLRRYLSQDQSLHFELSCHMIGGTSEEPKVALNNIAKHFSNNCKSTYVHCAYLLDHLNNHSSTFFMVIGIPHGEKRL